MAGQKVAVMKEEASLKMIKFRFKNDADNDGKIKKSPNSIHYYKTHKEKCMNICWSDIT